MSNEARIVKRHISNVDYAIWTKEYQNRFVILDGSKNRDNHEAIMNLKAGQTIELMISDVDFDYLNDEDEDIVIRGLSVNGRQLFSYDDFQRNRQLYGDRKAVIFFIIGIFCLLNGLNAISRKGNYAMIGITVAAFLVMWFFEFGLYA